MNKHLVVDFSDKYVLAGTNKFSEITVPWQVDFCSISIALFYEKFNYVFIFSTLNSTEGHSYKSSTEAIN